MKKEEFIKNLEDLKARYISESGIIGSLWLNWILEEDQRGNPVSEWVEIIKVISSDINDDNDIVVNTVELGSITKDYDVFGEDGPVIVLDEYKTDPLSRCDLIFSSDSGDIRIDEGDFEKLKYILYDGDSDFSPARRMEEAAMYLKRCGFEQTIFRKVSFKKEEGD